MLLVGVNCYRESFLPALRYPALDCQGLSEALTEATQALPQRELQIHHDFAEQLPTGDRVKASLRRMVTEAQPQDTLLFYFSGHGVLEARKQQAVLCFSDTQPDALLDNGLGMAELLHLLDNCAARHQVVWLDACHSGRMSLRDGKGERSPDLPNPTPQLMQVLRQQASQSRGFYALLSCDQNQQSWEFPELGHGVFTYFLMRGLRGEAADSQGVIEADGLYRYVYHQTLQYIDKTNQQLRLINQQKRSRGDSQVHPEYPLQTPKRIVEGVGELVLGMRSPLATPVNLRRAIVVEGFSDSDTSLNLSKRLQTDGGFELEYWPRPGQDWSTFRQHLQTCLEAEQLPDAPATLLLYLRGRIEANPEGDAWLILENGVRLSRSWLRQSLRRSSLAQIILILDCPGAMDLEDWLEDLQLGPERGQCLIAAAAPASEQFAQVLLKTLEAPDSRVGLPAAGWIARLQVELAGTGIPLLTWLSGSQGVIEILPGTRPMGGTVPAPVLDLGICPYMGLRAFSEADSRYFYGRETLTRRLLQQLQQQPALVLVGASGSGKSSVVRAGVLAQLRQGRSLPGSDQWWIGWLRPGDRPLSALARRLGDGGTEAEQATQQLQIEGLLHLGPEGLIQWLRSRPEPMVVLVVDQFEELFTLADAEERQRFLNLLLEAVREAGDRFRLILCLRADFIAPALEVPALAPILQQASVLVPPCLSQADYREVITRPAEQVGLQVEPELVEVLLQELSHTAGDLPLLEFVLEQLWQQRQAGTLTLQAYQQQIGGLRGALERKAQAVYDGLAAPEQDCARWIFLSLTQLGDGTEDTRRRIPKADLVVTRYPAPLVERTLQALTAAKLVVVGLEEEGAGQSRGAVDAAPPENSQDAELGNLPVSVEVAHEILIRHWSTLRWWLEENRLRLRTQRQLEQAALAWKQSGEQPDFLLRGVRLAEAEELYIQYTDELPEEVQRFVVACLEAQQQEQQLAKRRLRQAQIVAGTIALLGIAATGLAGLSFWQGRSAQLRQIETLAASSEAFLASNQQLEAVTAAVQAGWQLRQADHWGPIALPVPLKTQTSVIGALQQVLTQSQEVNRLEGHRNRVNQVSFSPDGQRLASVSDDGSILLWQRDGGRIRQLIGHRGRVTAIAFSPDGQLLVSASGDRTLRLWRSDGTLVRTFSGHSAWVSAVAFSPDGQQIVSGSRDGTVRLWDTEGKGGLVLQGHRGWVNTVRFSPDGRWVASGGEDGLIRLWPVGTSTVAPVVFQGHTDRVTDLAFSPDGKTLVSASGDRTVRAWNLKGQTGQILEGHTDQVNSVTISPDGQRIASADGTGTVRLWTLEGQPLQTFKAGAAELLSIRFSPDGQLLATASADKTVRLWQGVRLNLREAGFSAVRFSPDGSRMATAGWDRTIVLSQRDGSRTVSLKGHTSVINDLDFSPDGRLLVSASADRTLKVWNAANGSLLRTLQGHQDGVTTVRFSPNGQYLVSGSNDRTLKRWRVADGALMQTLNGHSDGVTVVRFSPDGQWFASGSQDKTIQLWRSDGNLERTLPGHGLAISDLAFSPDGKTLVSASWDNTVKLWSLPQRGLLRTLTGHQEGVTAVRFSPDGQLLFSGSAEGALKLWDWQQGSLLQTLEGPPDAVKSLDFTPDGRTLISASEKSGLVRWNLNREELLHQGCDRLRAYLTMRPELMQPADVCQFASK